MAFQRSLSMVIGVCASILRAAFKRWGNQARSAVRNIHAINAPRVKRYCGRRSSGLSRARIACDTRTAAKPNAISTNAAECARAFESDQLFRRSSTTPITRVGIARRTMAMGLARDDGEFVDPAARA